MRRRLPISYASIFYDLSNDFNRFYHDTKILSEEDLGKRKSYIRLITLAKDVLCACIQVLGFEAPERM